MSKAIIFDTETTGINEPEIVEAAWLRLASFECSDVIEESEKFKPSKPIELGAMAVHHIMDEDLVNCRPSSSFRLPDGTEYLIGHNVDFDWGAIGKPDVKRICTLALSRYLWPDIDSHSQSAMLYFLDRDNARERLVHAHSAAVDVSNCHIILQHIVRRLPEVTSWEELWLCSEKARIPKVMPFGKHKGTPIEKLPADYRAWLLRQPDIDQYMRKALTQ